MFRTLWITILLALLVGGVSDGRLANGPVMVDLDGQAQRQVVVDREAGQYLGHPTTCLLEDGRTILCVYPKGHGRGAIVYKRSDDGGRSWSSRLPTPDSWATSQEVPTLHRVIGPEGEKRVIMWSGLYPARLAVSQDDGQSWSELEPVGDWGGIVVMGFVEPLTTAPGHYLAMFHDDGRFFTRDGTGTGRFRLYKTYSRDGGLTWSFPEVVFESADVHLCEPGCIRSPDGTTLAVLLRENARRKNSHVIFSEDEGQSWSQPREVPLALTGDRHTGKYAPDGRLLISFRCISPRHLAQDREFEGDWVAWVGSWEDLVSSRPGQYVVRLKDNKKNYDTAYPGVEVLPDGTFVATTYGHWDEGESPYILSVRLKLAELDQIVAAQETDPWQTIASSFTPPEKWAEQLGEYRSPLLREDGTAVRTADEWPARRAELLRQWQERLGTWPPLITDPEVEVLETTRRENFQQLRIRFRWTPNDHTTGYLLIPDGEGRRPAVITVFYEPETAIGLGRPDRDFAYQLARRGFVTLSLGTTEATADRTYGLYYPDLDHARVQPLSMLAYAAANGWYVLAQRPEVDSQRIGIVGHSFGGKWAMFASCLFERFACAAWSDPGIVFDERRPNVNYWEPWYLGYHPRPWRPRGVITEDNPAHGLYPQLVASGRDLHELHALMAPRPFLVSGGSEDPPERWVPLNHTRAVNRLLGYTDRVGMTNRPDHAPNEESNAAIYAFFEHFLNSP